VCEKGEQKELRYLNLRMKQYKKGKRIRESKEKARRRRGRSIKREIQLNGKQD
jgi:hypothetical protein